MQLSVQNVSNCKRPQLKKINKMRQTFQKLKLLKFTIQQRRQGTGILLSVFFILPLYNNVLKKTYSRYYYYSKNYSMQHYYFQYQHIKIYFKIYYKFINLYNQFSIPISMLCNNCIVCKVLLLIFVKLQNMLNSSIISLVKSYT